MQNSESDHEFEPEVVDTWTNDGAAEPNTTIPEYNQGVAVGLERDLSADLALVSAALNALGLDEDATLTGGPSSFPMEMSPEPDFGDEVEEPWLPTTPPPVQRRIRSKISKHSRRKYRPRAENLALATWLMCALSDNIRLDKSLPDEIVEPLRDCLKLRLEKLLYEFNPRTHLVLLAGLYFCRMLPIGIDYLGSPDEQYIITLIRLFLISFRLVTMWADELEYGVAPWATMMELEDSEIRTLEVQALTLLDYNLCLSNEDWNEWLCRLRSELDTISDEFTGNVHRAGIYLIQETKRKRSGFRYNAPGTACPALPDPVGQLALPDEVRLDLEDQRGRMVYFATFRELWREDVMYWQVYPDYRILRIRRRAKEGRRIINFITDSDEEEEVTKKPAAGGYVASDEGSSVSSATGSVSTGSESSRSIDGSSSESVLTSESEWEFKLDDPVVLGKSRVFSRPPPGYMETYKARAASSTASLASTRSEPSPFFVELFEKIREGDEETRKQLAFSECLLRVPLGEEKE